MNDLYVDMNDLYVDMNDLYVDMNDLYVDMCRDGFPSILHIRSHELC